MEDNDWQEEGGLIDRIKESPRTVSALIIILIVAAAIYAFSGDEGQVGESGEVAEVAEEEMMNEEGEVTGEELDEEGIEIDGTTGEVRQGKVAADKSIGKEAAKQEVKLPKARRTDKSFVEVAEAGNGVTHLARRASARWLSENQAGYAVTDEHRIFIEDYVQNKLGTNGLALGEEVEISFDLIAEAVEAAKELNEMQLKNLSQYTYVLQ